MSKLSTLSVAQMDVLLERGEVAAEELVSDALERIRDANPAINAFVHVDESSAIEAARAADDRRKSGRRLSPFDGIPFGVKDNLYVGGMPATWGSTRWRGFVPERSDICVERLQNAGAIVIGKTNTPELAMSFYTNNDLFGPTRNPHDLSLTPGGSSGGSAAAVASGMVPFALGTDAGGSIRTPASLTGLYGLRPSNGRIPRAEGFAPLAWDFQSIGLLASTLEDLAFVYATVSGEDRRDPTSFLVPSVSKDATVRVGWFTHVNDELVDDLVVDRVVEAVGQLGRAGFETEKVDPPYDLARVRSIWSILTSVGVATAVGRAPDPIGSLTPVVAGMRDAGLQVSGEAYSQAMTDLLDLRKAISTGWGSPDVLVLPTTPTAAWDAETPAPTTVAGVAAGPSAVSVYTTWVNAAGYPAMSIPRGAYPDGRPIGIQLVARPGQESSLFRVAQALLGA